MSARYSRWLSPIVFIDIYMTQYSKEILFFYKYSKIYYQLYVE